MAQTLSEQIFSNSVGRLVKAGETVVVQPDVSMGHDSLSPGIIRIMKEQLKVQNVHDPAQIILVMDHVAPASTVGTANSQNLIRAFAREQGIRLFEVGRGICHQVMVEEKLSRPGRIVIGSDSHTTSAGAVAAFGTGMGSTDIALSWALGQTWMRVPETIRIDVTGRFQPGVDAKDLALKICRELTIGGANYVALEYHGLDWMALNQRQTVASMAIEVGAKAGLFPPDGIVAEQFEVPEWLHVADGANYLRRLTIDLDELQPQVAIPHAVDDVVDLEHVMGTPVDAVFLGTCTNGRYEDMREAADFLQGRPVAVRLIVSPASSQELQKAIADGTLTQLLASGATLTTPGCGACMGRHQGTLGEGDVCLSTGNRNFRGRMGHPSSQIYLASPAVAAATALAGCISDPREITLQELT